MRWDEKGNLTIFSAVSEVVGGASSVYPELELKLGRFMAGRATATRVELT